MSVESKRKMPDLRDGDRWMFKESGNVYRVIGLDVFNEAYPNTLIPAEEIDWLNAHYLLGEFDRVDNFGERVVTAEFIQPDPEPLVSETPSSILLEADALINGERQAQYGSPLVSFSRIADFGSIGWAHKLHDDKGNPVKLTAEDVNWFLNHALKSSRAVQSLITGDYHEDTHRDEAGYAGCAQKIHREREALANEPL